MAQQTIDIGAAPNDGTGDPLRDAFDKANDNFTELYTGRMYVLGQSAVAVSHTGNTNETTLATVNIPAGAMGANGQVIVEAIFSHTASGNNKTPRVKFGGTLISGAVQTTTASSTWRNRVGNRNSEASQVFGPPALTTHFGQTSASVATASVNTASSTDITFTGQLANSGETITLESYIVWIIPKA